MIAARVHAVCINKRCYTRGREKLKTASQVGNSGSVQTWSPGLHQFAAASDNFSMTDKRLVLSTCGSHEVATKIARALVVGQIAACVNVLGPMESVYRWKGTVETSHEFLLVIKTTAENFERLCAEITRLNPYELPEVLQFTVEAGLPAYLDWIGDSVTGTQSPEK
jgi:periplasmic divalent cation tolerance protein